MSTPNAPFVLMNDEIMPLAEARVPVNDRSFLFGDSVYEVIATYQGQPFFTRDHLERMRATAKGIHMDLPWDNAWFEERIKRGLERQAFAETYIRIVVSRGSGDFDISLASTQTPPQAVFIFKQAPSYGGRFRETGFHLSVAETRRNHPRSLNPAFKTGNYLNNILCLQEARTQGADDALILDLEGHVTELTTSNFFIVKKGEVWTAPLEVGILDGITRRYLIQQARALGLTVQEKRFTLEDVWQAEEAFVSSTLKGAMPVARIDDHHFRQGYGPLTRKLDEAYWAYVAQHLDRL